MPKNRSTSARVDEDLTERVRKIRAGHYKYKGYDIRYYGYFSPDRCVWWEAINEESGLAEFHYKTLKRVILNIDNFKKRIMEEGYIKSLISWCKGDVLQLPSDLILAVLDYFKDCGAGSGQKEEDRIERRKIIAKDIVIKCLFDLNELEAERLESRLIQLAEQTWFEILKCNKGCVQVFRIDHLEFSVNFNGDSKRMLPLHHVHAMKDYEFLRQYFPEDHQIFDDFEDSCYYCLDI